MSGRISESQVNTLSLFLGEHMPTIKLLGHALADTFLHVRSTQLLLNSLGAPR